MHVSNVWSYARAWFFPSILIFLLCTYILLLSVTFYLLPISIFIIYYVQYQPTCDHWWRATEPFVSEYTMVHVHRISSNTIILIVFIRYFNIATVSFVLIPRASMDGALNASSHTINTKGCPSSTGQQRVLTSSHEGWGSVGISLYVLLYSESQPLHSAP